MGLIHFNLFLVYLISVANWLQLVILWFKNKHHCDNKYYGNEDTSLLQFLVVMRELLKQTYRITITTHSVLHQSNKPVCD